MAESAQPGSTVRRTDGDDMRHPVGPPVLRSQARAASPPMLWQPAPAGGPSAARHLGNGLLDVRA
jgi:hypothetical protein